MMRHLRLLLTSVLMLSLAGACANENSPKVVAYFSDVGDLVEAATVQINDVEIGTISDLTYELSDGRMVARVEMRLDPDLKISERGLTAVIRQTSLLGEQFVELIPVRAGPPYVSATGTTIPLSATDKRVDIETFLGDLTAFIGSGTIEDLNRFTHAQALILQGRADELGDVIDELDTFTGLLANRRADVAAVIERLASASQNLASNQKTIDRFFDSLEKASVLLADQGDELGRLFRSLRRFGKVNSAFLAKHEGAINRQFRNLRPILAGLAGARHEIGSDITKLKTFFNLFPKSLGGGPGGAGFGDYVQADAVLCEHMYLCNVRGEKGDVPGQGS
jgi:phospholipid/cholesterol/gamma-HCH transport system substrate-binding protein